MEGKAKMYLEVGAIVILAIIAAHIVYPYIASIGTTTTTATA